MLANSTLHNPLRYSGLIHMAGRVYDPNIGKFTSVDPVYQAPTNTQSVNPYSYVMNNPLSLVDPSGYCGSTTVDADDNTSGTGDCGKDDGDKQTGQRLYKGHNDTGTMDHMGGTKLAAFDKAVSNRLEGAHGVLDHGKAAVAWDNGKDGGQKTTDLDTFGHDGGGLLADIGKQSKIGNTTNAGDHGAQANHRLTAPCEDEDCGQSSGTAAPKPAADLPGRALTDNEIKAARTVFGSKIDYTQVRVLDQKFIFWQGRDWVMTPNGNIYWPGSCSDLVTCAGGAYAGTFIHEMTHVMQYQSGVHVKLDGFFLQAGRILSFGMYNPYKYQYVQGKSFDSYNIEQQGDVARDIYYGTVPNIILNPGGN